MNIQTQIIIIEILAKLEGVLIAVVVFSLVFSFVCIMLKLLSFEDAGKMGRFIKNSAIILSISLLLWVFIPSRSAMYASLAIREVSEIKGAEKLPENAVKYLNDFFEKSNKEDGGER